eukprot:CAMPEP_0201688262 /NCGR_PEP_ID=MMETSP0578-20130828/2003_1 /ASSEMBLY_ACC=CAM_ASM_000663 /TAXON_ID=267565 /ORGANISM="Skeletonema grethea, Strain CCMP 1804" /LENGTH=190 /DNA_ID=CAMNT_0048172505 /DNA_START=93 /DNA_END=665 /DNA_ORIENTATION=-
MPPADTVHPILKHPRDEGSPAKPATTPAAGVSKSKSDKSRHIAWDEHAIEEHDLLRGTRMKIDEPNTPYTHYDHHSDEESTSSGRHPRSPDENHPHHEKNSLANQWGDISSKLQAVADKRDACPLSPAPSRDSVMSDEEEKKKAEEHEKKFKDMRKKHYNEAEMMRKWREQHATMDDEEEDEDDDDDDEK